MATLEQELEAFTQFAKQKLGSGESASLDELYDEWREGNPTAENALAVEASLRDMEHGETGRPFDEFAKEFCESRRVRRRRK